MALKSSNSRFLVKTDQDVQSLLENAVPENTRKSTNMWTGVLCSFCAGRKTLLDLAACSAQDSNNVLCKYYYDGPSQFSFS